jgi:hypothetical protein
MDDLRETIASAMSEATSAPSQTTEAVETPSVASGGSEAPSGPSDGGNAPSADGGRGADEAPHRGARPTADGRARDATGRFAPKAKEAQAQTKQGGQAVAAPAGPGGDSPSVTGAAPTPPPPVPAEAIKAPVSLTPAEREHFAKAPVEVQKAFARLDREVRQTMQEAAPLRRMKEEVEKAFAPYQQFAQSIGQTPLGLAQQASQVALQISTAPAHVAAKVFADLIRSRPDVQLELINGHLDGQPQAQPQQPHIDPATIAAQAEERVWKRLQGERQEREAAKARSMVEEFASSPEHEFFQDVWPDMAGLIDAAKARNVELPLKDAYDRAVWANPELRAILQQRELAKSAATAKAATQRASAAGSSIRNQPASPVNGKATGDLRADIEAAFAQVHGR